MSKARIHLEPEKLFMSKLNGLDRSFSTREIFRDMLELWYCAWAKLTALTEEKADALEARYMQIVNRYPNKDTIRAMPELMAIAMMAVAVGGRDFLGDIAGQLEILDAGHGQFFTPFEVSRMLAQINLYGVADVIHEQGFMTISEPAAGAGSILLACADILQEQGFDPAIHMLAEAVDISPMAYHMCYLQLTWRGIPAGVIRGDTLRLELFESAWTLPAKTFHAHHGHLFDRPEYDLRSQQLSLFEDLQEMVGVNR